MKIFAPVLLVAISILSGCSKPPPVVGAWRNKSGSLKITFFANGDFTADQSADEGIKHLKGGYKFSKDTMIILATDVKVEAKNPKNQAGADLATSNPGMKSIMLNAIDQDNPWKLDWNGPDEFVVTFPATPKDTFDRVGPAK